jgi:hypothetical protein
LAVGADRDGLQGLDRSLQRRDERILPGRISDRDVAGGGARQENLAVGIKG